MVVASLLLVGHDPVRPPTIVDVGGSACGQAVLGTGFVSGDVVVTNAHVVAGATDLVVTDSFGAERPAVVVGFDPEADLAALLPASRVPSPTRTGFGDADSGDRGNIGDTGYAVRRRIRAHIGDIYGETEVLRPSLELQAVIVDGDSGAPLTASDGAVVGVVYARSRSNPNTAYAIRAAEVERFLTELSSSSTTAGPCR